MFQTFTSVSDERRKINRGKGQILMGRNITAAGKLTDVFNEVTFEQRIDQSEGSRQRGLLSRQGTTGTKALWLELTSMSSKSLHKTGQERERQWASDSGQVIVLFHYHGGPGHFLSNFLIFPLILPFGYSAHRHSGLPENIITYVIL